MTVVALLTDLGTRDYFVASMKGVISALSPDSKIVDITHDIEPFNVRRAAFVLLASYKWFPKGSVFVVVVDPGVGGRRKGIAIRTRNYFFVGPDNGVLSLAAKEDGVVKVVEVKRGLSTGVSRTFHGRDLFAPAAAALAQGEPIENLGEALAGIEELELPKPRVWERGAEATIVYVDRFGNAYTSVRGWEVPWSIGDEFMVHVSGESVTAKLLGTYSDAEKGEALLLVNSENYLELAVREGSFADRYGVREGSSVRISKL